MAVELNKIKELMDTFVKDKGWYEEHSTKPQLPENLAKSVSIEAAELLECFQWSSTPNKNDVADEIADVILYACQLANVLDIDIDDAVEVKLNKNNNREWK